MCLDCERMQEHQEGTLTLHTAQLGMAPSTFLLQGLLPCSRKVKGVGEGVILRSENCQLHLFL